MLLVKGGRQGAGPRAPRNVHREFNTTLATGNYPFTSNIQSAHHIHSVDNARSQCLFMASIRTGKSLPVCRVARPGRVLQGKPRGGPMAHFGGVGKALTTACVLASTAAAATDKPPLVTSLGRGGIRGLTPRHRMLPRPWPCNQPHILLAGDHCQPCHAMPHSTFYNSIQI